MQFNKLRVLLWKHAMVRFRRFLHTPLEFFSPILLFVIVFIFKEVVKSNTRLNNDTLTVGLPDAVNLTSLKPPMRILYMPNTEHANTLMDVVGASLNLYRSPKILTHKGRGYHGVSNQSKVEAFVTNRSSIEAVVLFENLEDVSLPKQLKYTVRMGKRSDFFPSHLDLSSDVESPNAQEERHSLFGSVYNTFMRLQWAIDTSFMKILNANEVTQNIWLQEFPYYRSNTNKEFIEMKFTLIYFMSYISLFIVFVSHMSRLLEERASGIQELIRMLGVSSHLLGISHFINALPAGVIYSIGVTILLKIEAYPFYIASNGCLIWLAFVMHFVSVLAMAFAFSYIVSNTTHIVSLSVFAYVGTWIPSNFKWTGPLTGLLPHKPLQWFLTDAMQIEMYGGGLSFSDINRKLDPNCGTVLAAYLCFLIQIAFYFLLTWYLSFVRPGKYGQALPWNFLFLKQYWSKNEVKPTISETEEEEYPITEDTKYFQQAPKDLEPGIRIENVTKIFPKQIALNKVTMNVYKGEITVLVGHNGAGKTTLMSIITGMSRATSGKVTVNGADAALDRDDVRKHLGLCTQHNLFFPDLTVLEHVMFFTLLKGGSFSEANVKSRALLEKLGINSKLGDKPSQLSGGMKRRLQLACALSGDASVLVLDEPTSGLDVETRKGLWDLLLSLRGSRTVLLTTHFMEEADALGDRVAALHHGTLRCHATPMYLKKAIGTGYRLNITTSGLPKESIITTAITTHIPETALKDKTINSLTYNLPSASSNKFPDLFATLEQNKAEFGIETIGVGVSTLDDVFMKLCSDVDTSFTEDEVDSAAPVSTLGKVTGFMLFLRQFWYLLKRQFYYVWDKKIAFAILQVFIPILVICVFTANLSSKYDENIPKMTSIDLNLELYSARQDPRVLFDVDLEGVSMRSFQDQYHGVKFVPTDNITEVVLRAGRMKPSEYGKYLAGVEMTPTDIKILYSTVTRHTAPVALNLATNILATRSSFTETSFDTKLYPLDSGPDRPQDNLYQPKSPTNIILWSTLIVFVVLSTVVNFITLPCQERLDGTRHIHIMSGCGVCVHWLATCVFHITVTILSLIVPAAIACATLDPDDAFKAADFIGAMMLSLFLSSLAFLSFMYWISFFASQRCASILLIASLVLFGLITTLTSIATDIIALVEGKEKQSSYLDWFLNLVLYTMPPQAATLSVIKCANAAANNAACDMNKQYCPNVNYAGLGFNPIKCCGGEKVSCYLCQDEYAPWQELIILTCQFIVYMTLVLLSETGVFGYIREEFTKILSRFRRTGHHLEPQQGENYVRAEALFVDKQIDLRLIVNRVTARKQLVDSNHAMLFHNLHKNYVRLFKKNVHAVKGISLSIKKGECFGLLGVNGAGKSTTFKMLTAESTPTAGHIYANGHFRGKFPLNYQHFKYLRSLGYCPQFSGVDSFMTGRDNLELLLALRGFYEKDLKNEADYWIKVVGLEKYSARKVSGYSGGCGRRLAAAAALCSGARVALLDEPTAGVDVAARRRVWAALRRGLARGQAIIISSHSMEEIEALCARIAIMSMGTVRVLGSPGELRALYAGHALLIKLHQNTDQVDGAAMSSNLNELKNNIQSNFKCTLKDEHKTVLHYHITDTLRYSEIFTTLETLRGKYSNLIEDYSVTETTLEQVFMSIAKEEQHLQGASSNNIV